MMSSPVRAVFLWRIQTPEPSVSLSLSSTFPPSFSQVTTVLKGQLLRYLQADMYKAQKSDKQ